jgi:hypothetical protein
MNDGSAGYRTVRRLGRGGMGVVDLALDPSGHQVALKRISLHGTPEEVATARGRIRREADVLRKLDHPALVQLVDVFDEESELVLVMPYLGGGTLADRVASSGPLPAEEVMAMAGRLLDGLAHAHRSGVVHRDIKPANVLFDAEGNAYLGDFGAATTRDVTRGLTGTNMVLGTPSFMAPEQARGSDATPASDVFSLGATLLLAATGAGPYGTGDGREMMFRAAQDKVEKLPPTLPPEVRELLAPMLEAKPERRPTAAALRPRGPHGTSPHTEIQPPVRRRRRLVVAAAAVLVVVLAGATAFFLTRDDSSSAQPAPTTAAPGPTCKPLPYQPCGDTGPAPFTDGTNCLDGHADFDGDKRNGCEAARHGRFDTVFDDGVTIKANLVPGPPATFDMPVSDHFQLTCDGTLSVTLTAPKGVAMRLEVYNPDGDRIATAVSADGAPGTATMRERHCASSDSGTYRAKVSWIGSERSAADFSLTRSGSF